MISLSSNQIGRGWVQVPEKELLRTNDQWFSYSTQTWKTGSVFTSEKRANPGKVPWRRPVTFAAKLSTFPGLLAKTWNYKIKTFFFKPNWK